MHFFEKLEQASQANSSLLCVGLDPDPERTPADVAGFLRSIVFAFNQPVGWVELQRDPG